MYLFALLLSAFWGGVWAAYLQWTKIGRFLALKRTWITVVIGVGIDLLIALLIIPKRYWIKIFSIIASSSLFIIARSLYNEWDELMRWIDAVKKR